MRLRIIITIINYNIISIIFLYNCQNKIKIKIKVDLKL